MSVVHPTIDIDAPGDEKMWGGGQGRRASTPRWSEPEQLARTIRTHVLVMHNVFKLNKYQREGTRLFPTSIAVVTCRS